MPNSRQLPRDRTSPLIWLLAILCTVIAVAVILVGIVVFTIYLVYRPRIPYLRVSRAHLDRLDYDQNGLLAVALSLTIAAENDNARASAWFSDARFDLRFHDVLIAELRADPFDVARNSSLPLSYVVDSSVIPLDQGAREEMDSALKEDKVSFSLGGQTRARWRVGVFLSVKFLAHLSCTLQFSHSNGSSVGGVGCSSKSN
ncbi:hypothetical protein HPP92_022732 [Vanilla planifolia]|uniref:Late embryogenesis abundant protein LEA-2 subgroup domain-containing protein n=1 Tax=Vanilla planifolia TaxID=51239 RepID=A0A835PS20_VANPL|nr:hypothetical protein HPP92_022732 [Vanilla planifolia]